MIKENKNIHFFILFLFFFSFTSGLQAQENKTEELLSQADILYIQGEYEKARALYVEVSRLTDKKWYLSRAYFGAALCSFNLNDEMATKEYLVRVFLVDPKKEISALFYPQSFIKIFQEIKEKVLADKEKNELLDLAQEKVVEKEISKEKTSSQFSEPFHSEKFKKRSFLSGHWELNVHYGRWSLEPVFSLLEKNLKKRIGSEIRRELTNFLSSRYGSLSQSAYTQQLSLDIGGENRGLGVRYFSLGEQSSFGLGLSIEKTNLRLKVKGSIAQNYDNNSKAEVESEAFIQAEPVLALINFSWFSRLRAFFSPYFVFGVGYGSLNGKMGYSYRGNYQFAEFIESIMDSKEKTFRQWKEEEQSHISLEKIILIQLSLGFRLAIYRGLSFYLEAGFWDGFLINGGLAFRL